jgi:hypothetical protein
MTPPPAARRGLLTEFERAAAARGGARLDLPGFASLCGAVFGASGGGEAFGSEQTRGRCRHSRLPYTAVDWNA